MGIVVPCVVLGSWAGSGPGTTATAGFVDLADATFVEIRTMSGEVAMSGELRDRIDAVGNVEKDAALLGPGYEDIIGEIEIEIPRPDAPDLRQELEIDVISLTPFTSYQVFVNDRPTVTVTTDDRGSVDMEFLSGPPASR